MNQGLSGKQKTVIIILAVLIVGGLVALWLILRSDEDEQSAQISDFAACAAAGYPVMESYPRQCAVPGGQTYTEDLTDAEEEQSDTASAIVMSEKGVEIVLSSPLAGQTITSPLTISGEVPGSWSFEGSFPIVLTNWDGLVIALTTATLEGDWMTEELVPFTAELSFEMPDGGTSGSLILQNDNPSGLAENDDAAEVSVQFE